MGIILAMVAFLIQGIMSALFLWSLDLNKIGAKPSSKAVLAVNSQKEIKNYTVGLILAVGMGVVAMLMSPLSLLVAGVITLGGISVGFVWAIFRFHHWDDLMTHRLQEMIKASQPSPRKSGKLVLGLLLLSFASHVFTSRVRSMVGAESADLAFGIFCITGFAVMSGYLLEHVTLYYLHRSDSQLPPSDDAM